MAEGQGLQNAKKGIRFLSFPPVLFLQLKRFEYDYEKDIMVKVKCTLFLVSLLLIQVPRLMINLNFRRYWIYQSTVVNMIRVMYQDIDCIVF